MKRFWAYLGLCIVSVFYLSPILFMLVGSLKPDTSILAQAGSWQAFWPEQVSLQNYYDVLSRVPFAGYFINSLFVTTCIVLCGLLINAMAGYAFARLRFVGRDLLFAIVLAIMIVPLEAIAVPLFYQVTLFGWRDTYIVQIVPFICNAFSIYLFYTYFLGLPKELEESARIDGAGVFRTFFYIVVPNTLPVFASVAILTFLSQWGSFLWPLMVTTSEAVRPLPLAIATFQSLPPLQWGDIFAFGVMMVLPVMIVFILFQRWFVRGVVTSGIKG